MKISKKSRLVGKRTDIKLNSIDTRFSSSLKRKLPGKRQPLWFLRIRDPAQVPLGDLLIPRILSRVKKDGFILFWLKLPFYLLQLSAVLTFKLVIKIKNLLTGPKEELETPDFFNVALSTDWRKKPKTISKKFVNPDRLTINWVVPTIGKGGGARTIFRFVKFLADQGHDVRVYEIPIDSPPRVSASHLQVLVRGLLGDVKAKFYIDTENMDPADVTIATAWWTAYPVFNFSYTLKKFYLVQDFEPYFTAVSSESALAESTYRFGFHGFAAGKWLSEKLFKEFGMRCDHFDLAVDHEVYFNKNKDNRNKVFFYVRPSTPRRGSEIGIKALEIFAKRNPKFKIVIAGQKLGEVNFAFPFIDVGYVEEEELNDIYNESAVALVISLTNYSLLPLEIVAAGCPVVTNFGENNEKNLPEGSAIYSEVSPFHLAEAMENVVRNPHWQKISQRAEESAKKTNWEYQLKKFEGTLKESLKELGVRSLIELRNNERREFENKILASVVIPTFNGETGIKELLDGVFKQKTDFRYEVIVIDSGSKDRTVEVVKKYPARLIQIPNEEFGHGRTRNMGVKVSQGEYIAFLTQDALLETNQWLQYLVDAFYLDEKVGVVYGLQRPKSNCDLMTKKDMIGFFDSMGPRDRPTVQYVKPKEILNNEDSRFFFSDVNSCIKKSIWKKVPYRDLEYAEDQALGRDMLRAGYKKVYEPRASVIHSHSYPLFEYFQRQFDEYLGFKKAIGYVTKESFWNVLLESIKGARVDVNYFLNQNFSLKEKVRWLNAAVWMNLFRRMASYLAAKEDILPKWAKEKISLEYKQRRTLSEN